MTLAGLVLGVGMVLLGLIGGPELRVKLPSIVTSGGFGGETQQQQLQQLRNYEAIADQALTAYTSVKTVEFVALVLAPILGLGVGAAARARRQTKFVSTAAGVFVGTIVMVFLGAFLASTQVPSLQFPPGGGVVTFSLTLSVQFVQLLINALLVAVVGGVAAVGGVFLGDYASELRSPPGRV
jgi:hypothetical protein